MSDPAVTYAAETLAYEKQFEEEHLLEANTFPLVVEIPVDKILQRTFLEAVANLRAGTPVSPQRHGEVIDESVSQLVEKFEEHYVQYQTKKAESLGFDLPTHVLTRGERDHLRMFVQFLLREDARAHLTGRKMQTLERIYERNNASRLEGAGSEG